MHYRATIWANRLPFVEARIGTSGQKVQQLARYFTNDEPLAGTIPLSPEATGILTSIARIGQIGDLVTHQKSVCLKSRMSPNGTHFLPELANLNSPHIV